VTTDEFLLEEESLDPDNWNLMRVLGHRMLDDALDYLETLREQPAWQPAPASIKAHFEGDPPLEPASPESVYEEYLEYIRPYHLGNCHPRWWGWVGGTGTVMGAYAELLATSINTVSGAFSFLSPNYVEIQVVDWIKKVLGYPISASGLLTNGCSASNLIGLAVARNTKASYDLRGEGLCAAPQKMVLYASSEAHSSVQKAVELLGLGSNGLHIVPVNQRLEMDLDALRTQIERDREAGYQPFCVVGVAGTTNTGAIDDLRGIAEICLQEDLWFHVDAAFGAWAAIAPESKDLVAGMELADSLACDLHKFMYLPYAIGCVLVRSEEDHRRSFSLTPTYLAHGEGDRGLTAVDVPWVSDYDFVLSRPFPALKAWMTIKEHGMEKYGRVIQQNIDQAHYLAGIIESETELELALPVSLNVVCFRFIRGDLEDAKLDNLNKQIEIELQERGIAVPSIVSIRGVKYLHVAITNHRTRREDLDVLVENVIQIGSELALAPGNLL
jgi:glutamate/tyrosine decarboxylase-like PLP-dependent enzyme